MAGVARDCLRDPGLGRPPRSLELLTAFSNEPFGVVVLEVGTESLRKAEGTVGDGEGGVLTVSG